MGLLPHGSNPRPLFGALSLDIINFSVLLEISLKQSLESSAVARGVAVVLGRI